MATIRQQLGEFGERVVSKECSCPKCKRLRTLVRLPTNFKCADVVCDFCGFLGQVKATTVKDISLLPKRVLGAAWGPQKERMQASIYFPLFLVLVAQSNKRGYSIFYLSPDLQRPEMFEERPPLSAQAVRAGWQGFIYNLETVQSAFVRLR